MDLRGCYTRQHSCVHHTISSSGWLRHGQNTGQKNDAEQQSDTISKCKLTTYGNCSTSTERGQHTPPKKPKKSHAETIRMKWSRWNVKGSALQWWTEYFQDLQLNQLDQQHNSHEQQVEYEPEPNIRKIELIEKVVDWTYYSGLEIKSQ